MCVHICVFSLVNDSEIDVQNHKQMGGRRESDMYRLSERPRNSWWLHGQRSGDTREMRPNKTVQTSTRMHQNSSRSRPLLVVSEACTDGNFGLCSLPNYLFVIHPNAIFESSVPHMCPGNANST